MQLQSAHVTLYRSVEDSDEFTLEPDVTCLVGKNESGKTAVLQALYKLNPVEKSAVFDEVLDFPSRLTRQRKTSKQRLTAVRASFALTNDELAAVEADLGKGVMENRFTVFSGYRYKSRAWNLTTVERVATRKLAEPLDLPAGDAKAVNAAGTIDELLAALEAIGEKPTACTDLIARITAWPSKDLELHIIDEYLAPNLPVFVYFDDYSNMPGKVSVPDLIARAASGNATRGERALLALLDVVGVDLADFESADKHEYLIRETENAANAISDEVFEYWSQNKELDVELEILQPETAAVAPLNVGPILEIRVRNRRHRVSVPFDERSRGFVWFFSFLAYFSQLEEAAKSDLILLLDEPGLSLHATAQNDLLRLIDERLAPQHQVIYTTHSPFLVNPHKISRARTVTDVDEQGTKVSSDVLRADDETVFPLQAALGYELAQSLFVAPNNLLVEGPSDLIYLEVLSDILRERGKQGLDRRWVMLPVGGSGKLSTFVSLLGANKLNVAVLMDASTQGAQAVQKLRDTGRLKANSLVTVGDVLGRSDADIEDLFDTNLYLELVNQAYAKVLDKPIKSSDLKSKNPRLVKRFEEHFDKIQIGSGGFNHYSPAEVLLRDGGTTRAKISDQTLDHAEELFKRLNACL
jgi:predicted ATPase